MQRSSRRFISALVMTLVLGACGPDSYRVEPVNTQTPSGEDRFSQPARVTQRMGSSEITIVYNRPVARGRELFGALDPWDSVWNPGADEATRIETNEPISVAGQPLPAGRYSIWAIPSASEWTLVFSRSWDVDHLSLEEGSEALRISVQPRPADHMESLAFYFPFAEADSAQLALHWGETMLSVPLRRAAPS